MLAIRGARLFDGSSPTLVERPIVYIDRGVIVGVESGGEPPSDAEVVDLGDDVTLLPGLVDAHVHLVFDASTNVVGRLAAVDDDELLRGARMAAARALAAGITTVRDLGDRGYVALRLRESLASAPHTGPEVLGSGPPITAAKGHCWYLGGEATGVSAVREAVRARASRGAHVIKVMTTGGELTPGTLSHEASYSVAELRAAADEAHRHGLPITGHAHGAPGMAAAVAAGFDSVEHGSFLTHDGGRVDEEVFAALVRSGMTVSATLGSVPGSPPPPKIAALIPHFQATFRRYREAGVAVVISSDSGIAPPKPHDVLPYAPDMYAGAGATPAESLRAITSAAADHCRVGDRKGRLAVGYDADLLAVHGDPLADAAALRAVAAVFRAGHRVR